MFDYNATRRELLDGASHIGRAITRENAADRLSAAQLKHFRGKSLMIDEVWGYRLLAGGALVVELSYTWFLDHPIFGLTVYCVGALKADAEAWDHSLSGALFDVPAVLDRLRTLNEGGRERIAALAAAA